MNKIPSRRAAVGRDEIPPEYDFSSAKPNKYAKQYAAGSVVVVLDPDVASIFPTPAMANDALRALAGIIRKHPVRRDANVRPNSRS